MRSVHWDQSDSRGSGDVQRVFGSFGRNDLLHQLPRVPRVLQAWQGVWLLLIRHLVRLSQNDVRDIDIESLTVICPPIHGQFLVGRHDQISIAAGRQVARDSCFGVDAAFYLIAHRTKDAR